MLRGVVVVLCGFSAGTVAIELSSRRAPVCASLDFSSGGDDAGGAVRFGGLDRVCAAVGPFEVMGLWLILKPKFVVEAVDGLWHAFS